MEKEKIHLKRKNMAIIIVAVLALAAIVFAVCRKFMPAAQKSLTVAQLCEDGKISLFGLDGETTTDEFQTIFGIPYEEYAEEAISASETKDYKPVLIHFEGKDAYVSYSFKNGALQTATIELVDDSLDEQGWADYSNAVMHAFGRYAVSANSSTDFSFQNARVLLEVGPVEQSDVDVQADGTTAWAGEIGAVGTRIEDIRIEFQDSSDEDSAICSSHSFGGEITSSDTNAYVANGNTISVYDTNGACIDTYEIQIPDEQAALMLSDLSFWDGALYFLESESNQVWCYLPDTSQLEAVEGTQNIRWCYVCDGVLYRSGNTMDTWGCLFAQNLKSGAVTQLADDISSTTGMRCPTSQGLYYISETDGFLYDQPYDGEKEQLTTVPAQNPTAAPDGTIYYLSGGNCFALGQSECLLSGVTALYAADSDRLIYSREENGVYGLYSWNLKTNAETCITQNDMIAYEPSGLWYRYYDVGAGEAKVGLQSQLFQQQ